jgi:hypothetical protein
VRARAGVEPAPLLSAVSDHCPERRGLVGRRREPGEAVRLRDPFRRQLYQRRLRLAGASLDLRTAHAATLDSDSLRKIPREKLRTKITPEVLHTQR